MIKKMMIFFSVTVLIGAIIILVQVRLYFKELRADYNDSLEQATQVAKEYLEEKYQQEVVYMKHTSIYDKMVWSITFSAVDDSEQVYTVCLHEGYDRTSSPIKKHFTVQFVTTE